MTRPLPNDRGFALLIVLWSSVLLTLLVTGIAASGRTDAQLAANLVAAAQAEAAADGAIHEAAFHLLDATSPWPADDTLRETRSPAGITVTLRIEDQAGRLNPNTASRELLRAALQLAGSTAADTIAASIAAWRFPRARGGGLPGLAAQPAPSPLAQQYRAAGLDYEPPGAPFQTIDELGLVLGMTPALLETLRPHLTIHTDTDPDPARADPFTRQALRLANLIPATPPASAPPPPAQVVAITAVARTPAGGRFTRQAILRLGRAERESPVTILEWH